MRLGALVTVAALAGSVDAKLVVPDWDYAFPTANQTCVNATATTPAAKGANERWVYHATPEGTPPAAGWPVWLSLVTDTFGSLDGTSECGGGRPGFRRRRAQHHHGGGGKSFNAFDTPDASMKSCFASPPADQAAFCTFEMERYCKAEEKEGEKKCLACAGTNAAKLKRACTQSELAAICNGTGPSPLPSPPYPRSECDYDQEAGALWNQRLKQYLIANGVAVVIVVRLGTLCHHYRSCCSFF